MCGILACFGSTRPQEELDAVLVELSKTLTHRGPDESGYRSFQLSGAGGLAHTRLSIMDPEHGHQPLVNADGSVTVICNGEIYNQQKLKEEYLSKYTFKTGSDNEVLVYMYEEFGPSFVNYLDGIFALAIFDSKTNKVFAARDPIGIKTLVIGRGNDGSIWLASEFKALGSEVETVEEFPPGHYYESEKDSFTQYYKPFWYNGDVGDVKPHDLDTIRTTVENAVVKRLMSDVPLGVLLSGGLDSSLVASIVKKHTKGPLHTFSVGLKDSSDLPKAREVAKALDTIHHEHVFTVEEGLAAVKDVVYHLESYDAAFIRSGVALYFLSKLAAKHVKVALSGEGADEVFAGYLYYYDSESPADLHRNSIEKIKLLHKSNVLFVDRMTMSASLEGRVPFLDKDVLDMTFSIDPADKMPYRGKKIEKFILRQAFQGYLPDSVLWRQKEQFSDGVGYSWADGLKDHAETVISDEKLSQAKERFVVDPPRTKEEYYIREIFEEHFPSHHHARMVRRWIPSFKDDVVEASGRAMKAHNACDLNAEA